MRTSCYRSEGMRDYLLSLLESFYVSKSWDEISIRGEDCDTRSVLVAATVPQTIPLSCINSEGMKSMCCSV
jgi:hypothetical protein